MRLTLSRKSCSNDLLGHIARDNMDSVTGWIIASCTLISLVITGSAVFLRLTLKLGLTELRSKILDDIRAEYANKQQTEQHLQDLEGRVKAIEQSHVG